MTSADRFSAELILRSAPAYAGLTARALLEHHPELGRSMGDEPFQTWKAHLEVRLRELAAALAESNPGVFVAQVHWSRAAWAARGVDPGGLRQALAVMADVLREELPPSASPTVMPYLDAALEGFEGLEPDELPRFVASDLPGGRLAAAYLKRLFEGDSVGAEKLILDAVRAGELTVASAFRDVLEPALREIGLMWQLGEATIPDEHFATGVTRRLLARLSASVEPARPNGRTLLAASVTRETHDVGLQLVAETFSMDGWRVVNLGADVPHAELLVAVEQYRADVVAISATMATHRREVERAIHTLRHGLATDLQPKILVGGLAFVNESAESWRDVGADGHAGDAAGAVRRARELVGLDVQELGA